MTKQTSPPQFDFGENWISYSRRSLQAESADAARKDFLNLASGIPLQDATFLDIGFGQGLSLLLADEAGARVTGCDINPKCSQALKATSRFFPGLNIAAIPLVIGSILEPATVTSLRSAGHTDDAGRYDIVHSWGVLHHTGDMHLAIRNAATLVRPGGHLIIALYNSHWSSPAWTLIKKLYVSSPKFLQRLLMAAFIPVIWTAKLLVTRSNPLAQQRGMDFCHDVVDWVGGYPYEHATVNEVVELMKGMKFQCLKAIPPQVPTGCNEFVFRKASE